MLAHLTLYAAQDNTATIAIASVISAAVAALAGTLTARSSARSNQVVAETQTRGDIEQEAFVRAEGLLSRQFERQEAEITELTESVQELRAQIDGAKQQLDQALTQLDHYRRVGRRLARGVYVMRQQLAAMEIATPADPELDDAVLEFLGTPPV